MCSTMLQYLLLTISINSQCSSEIYIIPIIQIRKVRIKTVTCQRSGEHGRAGIYLTCKPAYFL